ncbi:MAG: hypothetical protein ACOCRX_05560 [Candidatus Woesearchaeota archaeon]
MKSKEKIEVQVKEFCQQFNDEKNKILNTLKRFNLNVSSALPEILLNNFIEYECVFSESKNHILIMMSKNDEFTFHFNALKGDVINYLDESDTWKEQKGSAFKINNSTNINIKGVSINGMKPFELSGDKISLFINDLFVHVPKKGEVHIDFAIIMSYPIFLEKAENVNQFSENLLSSYVESYNEFGNQFGLHQEKNYCKNLLNKMKKYFFDEDIKEVKIDKFLQENPIILRRGLNIIEPMSQVILKDILDKYGQDLKPDLIGFNLNKQVWEIIDYKRAKKTILKNVKTVRSSFRAEVRNLEAQLRDYKEYFNEKDHREYFKKKYGYNIEYPRAVGIIGNVSKDEQKEFNRQIENLNNWLDIIPYNYLYNNFKRFVEILDGVKMM